MVKLYRQTKEGHHLLVQDIWIRYYCARGIKMYEVYRDQLKIIDAQILLRLTGTI